MAFIITEAGHMTFRSATHRRNYSPFLHAWPLLDEPSLPRRFPKHYLIAAKVPPIPWGLWEDQGGITLWDEALFRASLLHRGAGIGVKRRWKSCIIMANIKLRPNPRKSTNRRMKHEIYSIISNGKSAIYRLTGFAPWTCVRQVFE